MSVTTHLTETLALRDAIARKLGAQATTTWFRSVTFTQQSDRVLEISAPNSVVRDWIVANYANVLESCLRELALDRYELKWQVLGADRSTGVAPGGFSSTANDKLRSRDASPVHESPCRDFRTTLNPKYTFDNFVVGSCNRFAHAGARAVGDSPGKTYNPLYIYGPVGLGKTHLIQAIGQAITQRYPSQLVAFVSLERFMNELINAIRYGYEKTQEFRDRYRTIDVLLMDDIQFLAGKERTQEEFFHTFNALYENQKQIVVTSDSSPRDIPEIEERLHSRFEWGLIADLHPPDLETKVAILRRKAEQQGFKLPDDVALHLASTSKHNIRELEGSLVRLLAIGSMRGVPLSMALAEDVSGKASNGDREVGLSIRRVQEVVAAQYRLRVDNLLSKSNVRQILLPRQVAMYLCKKLIGSSYPEIGRQFGGKHHTTVMHSVEKIAQLVSDDSTFRNTINRITDVLQNRSS